MTLERRAALCIVSITCGIKLINSFMHELITKEMHCIVSTYRSILGGGGRDLGPRPLVCKPQVYYCLII
jgi:hypothetical protein